MPNATHARAVVTQLPSAPDPVQELVSPQGLLEVLALFRPQRMVDDVRSGSAVRTTVVM